jgi:hypothetical protein
MKPPAPVTNSLSPVPAAVPLELVVGTFASLDPDERRSGILTMGTNRP